LKTENEEQKKPPAFKKPETGAPATLKFQIKGWATRQEASPTSSANYITPVPVKEPKLKSPYVARRDK
jgi:hypothetical protein